MKQSGKISNYSATLRNSYSSGSVRTLLAILNVYGTPSCLKRVRISSYRKYSPFSHGKPNISCNIVHFKEAKIKMKEPLSFIVHPFIAGTRPKRPGFEPLFLNEDGYIDFALRDLENPKNWSAVRRWYIVIVSLVLALNATFASSSPTGCFEVRGLLSL